VSRPLRLAFVGHVCRDENVVRGRTHVLHGGGVGHGAVTARRLGAEVCVLTRCAPEDRRRFAVLDDAGVEVVALDSPATTSIENCYPGDDPDDRSSRLLARAAPFAAGDLAGLVGGPHAADVVHVNPLVAGECPPALLPALRAGVPFLAADAQGFSRRVGEDGTLVLADPPDKAEWLPLLDLLKADAKEARALTGLDDPRAAARRLCELGPASVLVTHGEGAVLCTGGELSEAAFSGWTLEGRTGRGDTCTAAFLVARPRLASGDALRFAARVTSEKMRYPGPYRG